MKKIVFHMLAFVSLLPFSANAITEFPVQARLFAGGTATTPKSANAELEAEGMKKLDTVTQFGVEMTYPLLKFLDVGLRYTKRYQSQDENPSAELTDYKASVAQDAVMGIVRVPFLKSTYVRADAFAGAGGSNTVMKLKTATQEGEITRKDSGSFLASPVASAGASIGFGFKNFYLVFEGGFESNKVKDLKYTGTVNSNIETIDLSGSYLTLALMFDGIKATK